MDKRKILKNCKLFLEATENSKLSKIELATVHLLLALSLLGEEVDINQFLEKNDECFLVIFDCGCDLSVSFVSAWSLG